MNEPGDRCGFPVLDAKGRAKICGKPATTWRMLEGIEFSVCDACAVKHDAKAAPPPAPAPAASSAARIGRFIDRARGHVGRAAGPGRMRRIVVRLDPATLARVDALVPRFEDSSRASLIRAFTLYGLAAAEAKP